MLAGVLIRRTVPAMGVTAVCGLVLAVAGCGYGSYGSAGLFVLGYRVIPASTPTLTADPLTVAPKAMRAVPQIWPEVD